VNWTWHPDQLEMGLKIKILTWWPYKRCVLDPWSSDFESNLIQTTVGMNSLFKNSYISLSFISISLFRQHSKYRTLPVDGYARMHARARAHTSCSMLNWVRIRCPFYRISTIRFTQFSTSYYEISFFDTVGNKIRKTRINLGIFISAQVIVPKL
jgi:hypothetical protein